MNLFKILPLILILCLTGCQSLEKGDVFEDVAEKTEVQENILINKQESLTPCPGDWKEFIRKNYGFSICYPPEFSLRYSQGGRGDFIHFYTEAGDDFEVAVTRFPADFIFIVDNMSNFEQFSKIDIDNVQGNKFDYIGRSDCIGFCMAPFIGFKFKNNRYGYQIKFTKSEILNEKKIHDIIETFKFQ